MPWRRLPRPRRAQSGRPRTSPNFRRDVRDHAAHKERAFRRRSVPARSTRVGVVVEHVVVELKRQAAGDVPADRVRLYSHLQRWNEGDARRPTPQESRPKRARRFSRVGTTATPAVRRRKNLGRNGRGSSALERGRRSQSNAARILAETDLASPSFVLSVALGIYPRRAPRRRRDPAPFKTVGPRPASSSSQSSRGRRWFDAALST